MGQEFNAETEGATDDLQLCIDVTRKVGCWDDEYAFLGEHDGVLRDADTEVVAGKVRLFIVDVDGAREAGISAFDLLDLEGATEPYAELLSSKIAGNFCPAVTNLLGGEDLVFSNNMLIIDRVELLPAYRGKDLGLRCMETCLRHFRLGCRVAAIKPFPLQFESGAKESEDWNGGVKLSSFQENQRDATERLRRHYGRIGFRRVRRTKLMVCDLERAA
jgi:GNAT superfamily N-acetyltransferase